MKRTIAPFVLAAAATSVLSACAVVSADGYYDHSHYYHPYYRGY